MANKELKEVLDTLLETQRAADLDMAEIPPETRIGMATRKQEAVNYLPVATKNYTNELSKHIVKVFIKGSSAELEAYLKKEGGIVLNGNLLYDWLADNLQRPRVFAPQHTVQVMELLAEFCKANDIDSIPMPRWESIDVEALVDVPSKLINILKKGIRLTNKDDLTKFVLTKYTFLQAIKDKVTYNLVPVVIFNLSDDEITGLSDALFNGQMNVVLDVSDKKFDEVVAELNTKLHAANAALKRVTKGANNE